MRASLLGAVVLAAVVLPVSTAAAKCGGTRSPEVVSEAQPQSGLAARVGVLRRPQTAEDRATIDAFRHQGLRILYARSLRLLRSDPDGRSWYLYAGKSAAIHYDRRCLRRMPAHLRHTMLLQERRAGVKARKLLFGVFEFAGGSSGGFFGGDLRALTHNLATLSVWHADDESTSVSSLVPDGVAWVDVTLRNGERRVIGVSDNFWQVDVDSLAALAVAKRTIWKAADGTVVGRFAG
jgi:hypothetical protein